MTGAWRTRRAPGDDCSGDYLADTSALARLHHDDVAARVQPLFLAGASPPAG